MSPSVTETRHETSIVCWPQLNTALSCFIRLGRQNLSKKGFAVTLLYINIQ
jgi:hypothetical protein